MKDIVECIQRKRQNMIKRYHEDGRNKHTAGNVCEGFLLLHGTSNEGIEFMVNALHQCFVLVKHGV